MDLNRRHLIGASTAGIAGATRVCSSSSENVVTAHDFSPLGVICHLGATAAMGGGGHLCCPLAKTNLWFVPGLATARAAILENFKKAAAILLS